MFNASNAPQRWRCTGVRSPAHVHTRRMPFPLLLLRTAVWNGISWLRRTLITERFLAHIKLHGRTPFQLTPHYSWPSPLSHFLSIHHSSPPHLFSPPSRVRRAVTQYGGAMYVLGADTSAITVSISDGTTITSCSAVAGADDAVRARRPQQRVSLCGEAWVPGDVGAGARCVCASHAMCACT